MPPDIPLWFSGLVLIIAIFAGATASLVGFGIGSLLTPIFALRFGTDIAVAAVALPHLAGGLLRGWRLRRSIELFVITRFGLLSATGGLIGALLFAHVTPLVLTRMLGGLLVLTALAGISGWTEHWKPHGPMVWILGALSGFFGGVVGNQGGLRAAALSSFGLAPTVFVATSTIIGVFIDVVRTPVYLYSAGGDLAPIAYVVAFAAIGVLAGTLVGEKILLGLSPARFRTVVSTAVGALGIWFLVR